MFIQFRIQGTHIALRKTRHAVRMRTEGRISAYAPISYLLSTPCLKCLASTVYLHYLTTSKLHDSRVRFEKT